MSAAISPSTSRAYGVQRVCRVWELSRSTVYARRERAARPPRAVKRRGPVPRVSDADLLALVRRDLETSPFTGEGHRKVWARLRVRDGVRVARKRVLRVMRENHLLSPHRVRRGAGLLHEGTITTTGPNQMWGTDGAMVQMRLSNLFGCGFWTSGPTLDDPDLQAAVDAAADAMNSDPDTQERDRKRKKEKEEREAEERRKPRPPDDPVHCRNG